MAWYTIFVESGYEDLVVYLINRKIADFFKVDDYRLLVPKRKLIERKNGKKNKVIRKMFPGYVLVKTMDIYSFYKHTYQIPHILNYLRVGRFFLEIKENEINHIINLVNKDGIIEMSKGMRVGDSVRITNGPLVGSEGTIQKVDWRKCKVKVSFFINNCEFPIYLGLEDEYTIL